MLDARIEPIPRGIVKVEVGWSLTAKKTKVCRSEIVKLKGERSTTARG